MTGGIWKPVHLFASDEPLTAGQTSERGKALNRRILEVKDGTVRYDVWTSYAYDPIFPDSAVPGTSGKDPVPAAIEEKGLNESRARSFTPLVRARGA